MKKVFFIYLSVLVCMFASISDALAWANCTQNVPAGRFCKTAGSQQECRAGCYCTGNKTAVGTSINVAKRCSERTDESGLNGSGIYFCPPGTTSYEGATSVEDCFYPEGLDTMVNAPCPEGCFCLNNGEFNMASVMADYGWHFSNYSPVQAQAQLQLICQHPAGTWSTQEFWECNITGFIELANGNRLICDRDKYLNIYATNGDSFSYYLDEFSELYTGTMGGTYGVRNGEVIYLYDAAYMDHIYNCPLTYPLSESGAKTVYECYKYDANGNKVYYGANTNIVCAEGTYLPANATQCVACSASQNQVCPGGRFEKLDKIQGLRLNCPTGKYLPANATQCSSCDESQYFCFGGIYDYNSSEDQGRIAHNGYVNMGEHHTFITCNPGKYVPANSTQCTACTGNYICPGGIFFTDATYNVDRGKKLCPYGQPNANHTACNAKSSKPSWAREHLSNVINKPAESTSVMKQKIGKNEKVVSVATEKPIADSEETKVSAKDTKKSAEIQNKIDDSKNVKSLTTEKKTDLGKENTASKQTVAEEIKASATNTEKTVEVQKDVADSKKVKSSATEKKLDLGKISAPLAPKFDRALTQRPVPVSANIQETTDINSVVHGTMNKKSEQKRPSRYR